MQTALPILELVFETLLAHFRAKGDTNHPVVQKALALGTAVLATAAKTNP